MSLHDWQLAGWLTAHQSSQREIADLLGVAERDLADCQIAALSADWRLNIAYNAALQVALAALAAEGYRVAREAHHFRAIQSMEYSLNCDRQMIVKVEAFRKKRNISSYDIAGSVSDKEAREMYELAATLRAKVEAWIRKNHPKLVTHRPHP